MIRKGGRKGGEKEKLKSEWKQKKWRKKENTEVTFGHEDICQFFYHRRLGVGVKNLNMLNKFIPTNNYTGRLFSCNGQ